MKKGMKASIAVGACLAVAIGGFVAWKLYEDSKNAFGWPVAVEGDGQILVYRPYGMSFGNIFNKTRFHNGIDIEARAGSEILSSRDGIVEFADSKSEFGKCVILRHKGGLTTVYGHLDRFAVAEGQTVMKGDVIGYAGNTGFTIKPQLHFEIRTDNNDKDVPYLYVDPETLLPKLANIFRLEPKTASLDEKPDLFILPFIQDKYEKVDMTPGFGNRISPLTGLSEFHSGADIDLPDNAEILAAGTGKVINAQWDSDYGNYVEIDHGNNVRSTYGHMSDLFVKSGDDVEKGQVIGLCGKTGIATDPHLHFEVKVLDKHVDPLEYARIH